MFVPNMAVLLPMSFGGPRRFERLENRAPERFIIGQVSGCWRGAQPPDGSPCALKFAVFASCSSFLAKENMGLKFDARADIPASISIVAPISISIDMLIPISQPTCDAATV